jgi:hypothetical protein
MTSIEKSTISISKAAAVLVFICSMIVTYYTTKNATEAGVNKALYEINIKINTLENKDELILQRLDQTKANVDRLESAVVSYIGKAILPKEPAQEEDRRKRQ